MRAAAASASLFAVALAAWSVAAAPAAASPAPAPPAPRDCSSAEHRAFDFWIGEWEARERGAAPDAPPAHSSIQSILAGCVIFENWTEADGHQGKSLNAWDPVRHAWKQTWMDDQGGIGEFVGSPFQNGLRFTGESHWPGRDKPVQRRITYLPLADGTVEQASEASLDGVVWKPLYDLLYRHTTGDAAAPRP